MFKKYILAVIVAFIAISLMDWLIHGNILMSYYEETKELWRPENEMKVWIMYLSSFIYILGFVYIYLKFICNKSALRGFLFGLTWGFITGISMGYGTYSYSPIPYGLAFGWFLATLVEMSIVGWLTGLIVKE